MSASPGIRYVHEPFNISGIPCHCGIKFDYWFQYLSHENAPAFYQHLHHTIFPAFSCVGLLNSISRARQSRRVRPLLGYLQSYALNRALVKDPLAVISAGQLASLFDMDVVVVVRHPAAIASSYKTLKWDHPFTHFLQQPKLMDDHFALYRAEIEDFAQHRHDIVEQAALLWKLIYSVVIKYQRSHPRWIVVRYEDLASKPIEGYQSIFEKLQLRFSPRISSVIQARNRQGEGPRDASPYAITRDSRRAMAKWKSELSTGEITRIRARVEEVASVFFADRDWQI
jgi:hypothetical protein